MRKGNFFKLKPKGGPEVKIELIETIENKKFVDCTRFLLATMYGAHIFDDISEGLKITTIMTMEGMLSFLWIKLVAQGIADASPREMLEQVKFASKL